MAERAPNISATEEQRDRTRVSLVPSAAKESRAAYYLLRVGFTVAPIIAGFDKFTNLLTDWTQYLAPFQTRLTGLTASGFMQIVGVIEIIAGIGVAVRPKLFAFIVSAWLVGIIGNLLILGQFYDVALRDLGLAIGAFSLGLLSLAHDKQT